MGRLTILPGAASLPPVSGSVAGLNFRQLKGRILVTNDAGHHADLSHSDFDRLLGGTLKEDEPVFKDLAAKGFLKDRMDFKALIKTYQKKNAFFWWAPALQIVVVTLRCNHK